MTKPLCAAAAILSVTAAFAAEPAAKPAPAQPKGDKAIESIDRQIQTLKIDKSASNWRTRLPMPQAATFEAGRSYFARITTSKGPIRIKFLPETAPMHVTSFIYLSKLGFYDGLGFHRVITGFMAQGGCPLGTGTGGPGYKFDGEFAGSVRHNKGGLLSMANAGPGTDGSQFFLTFVATTWLDGKHTIFGSVVEGMDTLKALEAAGSSSGQTSEKLLMEKVSIEVE